MKKQLLQVENFRDFAFCPAFAKFNQDKDQKKPKESIPEELVRLMFSRLAERFNGTVKWNRIRKTVTSRIFDYKKAIEVLEGIRPFYFRKYRKLPIDFIPNITVSAEIQGQDITVNIDGILIEENKTTLVHLTNKTSPDVLKDIGLRLKLFVLKRNNVTITNILNVSTAETEIKWSELKYVDNPRTEQALELIAYCFSKKVFIPSPTVLCGKCKYKDICSW